SPSRISLPRKGRRVGLRIVLFEACSALTRVAACTLALSPIRDTPIEGFSHFVTSMTAPIASGWSVCRVGLAPTGKRRLCTAHTQTGHYPSGPPAEASGNDCIGVVTSVPAPPGNMLIGPHEQLWRPIDVLEAGLIDAYNFERHSKAHRSRHQFGIRDCVKRN